jgi:hypothetical protein
MQEVGGSIPPGSTKFPEAADPEAAERRLFAAFGAFLKT